MYECQLFSFLNGSFFAMSRRASSGSSSCSGFFRQVLVTFCIKVKYHANRLPQNFTSRLPRAKQVEAYYDLRTSLSVSTSSVSRDLRRYWFPLCSFSYIKFWQWTQYVSPWRRSNTWKVIKYSLPVLYTLGLYLRSPSAALSCGLCTQPGDIKSRVWYIFHCSQGERMVMYTDNLSFVFSSRLSVHVKNIQWKLLSCEGTISQFLEASRLVVSHQQGQAAKPN